MNNGPTERADRLAPAFGAGRRHDPVVHAWLCRLSTSGSARLASSRTFPSAGPASSVRLRARPRQASVRGAEGYMRRSGDPEKERPAIAIDATKGDVPLPSLRPGPGLSYGATVAAAIRHRAGYRTRPRERRLPNQPPPGPNPGRN